MAAHNLVKAPEQVIAVGCDFGNVGIGKHGSLFKHKPCGTVYRAVFTCIEHYDCIIFIIRFNNGDLNGIGDVEAVRCRNGCGAGGICGDNGMIVIAFNDADNIGIGACPCKRANNLSVRIGSIECIELIDCQSVADNKG